LLLFFLIIFTYQPIAAPENQQIPSTTAGDANKCNTEKNQSCMAEGTPHYTACCNGCVTAMYSASALHPQTCLNNNCQWTCDEWLRSKMLECAKESNCQSVVDPFHQIECEDRCYSTAIRCLQPLDKCNDKQFGRCYATWNLCITKCAASALH
jgi:hypothetical protein